MKINYFKAFTILVASFFYLKGAHAQQNLLIVNPGFESNKTGWYFSKNTEVSSAQAHSGSSSLKLTFVEGAGVITFYSQPSQQPIALQAGKKYKLELWVKPIAQTRKINLKVYAATGGFKQTNDINLEYSGKKLKMGEWQLVTYDFTANDYPVAKFSIEANLGELYFDDFKLYEVK